MSQLYLQSLALASEDAETGFILDQKRTCYKGVYPFKVFPAKELSRVDFAPVTIFYGGNGSGKTTLLNVIAQAVGAKRGAAFSGSAFFQDYVSLCRVQTGMRPAECRILTSDDVSDYLLDLRALNDGVDRRREALLHLLQAGAGAAGRALGERVGREECAGGDLPVLPGHRCALAILGEQGLFQVDVPDHVDQVEVAVEELIAGVKQPLAMKGIFQLSMEEADLFSLKAQRLQTVQISALPLLRASLDRFDLGNGHSPAYSVAKRKRLPGCS